MIEPLLLLDPLGIPHKDAEDMGYHYVAPINSAPSRSFWTGEFLLHHYSDANEMIFHEIAHWLVAPKEYHSVQNYGLSNYPGEKTPGRYPDPVEEESIVCRVAHAMEHLCDVPRAEIKDTLRDENFFERCPEYEERGVVFPAHYYVSGRTEQRLAAKITRLVIEDGIKWLRENKPEIFPLIQKLKRQQWRMNAKRRKLQESRACGF